MILVILYLGFIYGLMAMVMRYEDKNPPLWKKQRDLNRMKEKYGWPIKR